MSRWIAWQDEFTKLVVDNNAETVHVIAKGDRLGEDVEIEDAGQQVVALSQAVVALASEVRGYR